jgi:hypothetical protein
MGPPGHPVSVGNYFNFLKQHWLIFVIQ